MNVKYLVAFALCSQALWGASSKPKKSNKDNPSEQAFNEGYKLQKNSNYSAAIDKYSEAISLNSNYAEAYNNRAFCYKMIAKDYLKLSGQSYEKALRIKPQFPEALEYQGVYFIMNGEIENAYKNYKILLSLDEKEATELYEDLDPVLKQARLVLDDMKNTK
jgi:lipoprotein NlpI